MRITIEFGSADDNRWADRVDAPIQQESNLYVEPAPFNPDLSLIEYMNRSQRIPHVDFDTPTGNPQVRTRHGFGLSRMWRHGSEG